MKRDKQVQQNHFQHHSYLDDEAVIRHAEEASNSEKFKKLYAGEWEELYGLSLIHISFDFLLVEQITTIDRSALYSRLCRVTSAEKKQEIERAWARQFDMKHSAENTAHHHDGKEV